MSWLVSWNLYYKHSSLLTGVATTSTSVGLDGGAVNLTETTLHLRPRILEQAGRYHGWRQSETKSVMKPFKQLLLNKQLLLICTRLGHHDVIHNTYRLHLIYMLLTYAHITFRTVYKTKYHYILESYFPLCY